MSNVIIFAENKLYPTRNGFESFTFRPVLIVDGTVTNMKKEPAPSRREEQRTQADKARK